MQQSAWSGARRTRSTGRVGSLRAFRLQLVAGAAAALLMLFCTVGIAAGDDDFRAGQRAYQAGDVTGALQWLRKPADAGHAASQALLAFVLESAALYDEALIYYRKAVAQGNADAEFGLAGALRAANGVPQDLAQSRQLYERAAGRGHALAIQWLAETALRTLPRSAPGPAQGAQGVQEPVPTLAEADLGWVRKAAAADHLPSLDYLARAYRSGVLGPPDLAVAKDFESRADKLRYPGGKPRARRVN